MNNVYYAPTKPRDDTPAANEPKISPVPVQVPTPQPTKVEVPAKPKDETPVVDKEDPSPPVYEKVTPSVPAIPPAPVVPVNDTKPVDTPPAKVRSLPPVVGGLANTVV